jgi:hypothetical protein
LKNNTIKTYPITPSRFLEIEDEIDKIKENYDIKDVNYKEIYPINHPNFSLIFDEKIELPTRLYNIEKKEAELIKNGFDINNYAILPYV